MTKSATRIQDKDTQKRLSVVQSTEDPTKYWVVILNPDGSKISWPKWEAATVTVWTTTTGNPWTNASVVNSWTSSDAVLDFTIPRGDKWETWNAATIAVWTTTTWEAGTSASVTNSWDSHVAVFNFVIPKGDKGETWSAATVNVWTTTTGNPWTNASVTNSGTSSAAVLNFTIPRGNQGEQWETGNWIQSVVATKSWKTTTVTINYTDGSTPYSFQIQDWQDWEWAWDVLWPSSATDSHFALFDGNTGKLIKNWGTIVNVLNSTSTTDALSAAQGKALNDSIWTINGKISAAASTSNQLADKNYVDTAINSVAAYYLTKNAAGDQFATYAELAAATTFYAGWVVRVPTRNDYCIVADDENHDHATTRYIYNTNWEYQYIVNETALTSDQIAALNSGITAWLVSTYNWYASQISWKQNTLTAWTNVQINNDVISATDTTYSDATQSTAWLMSATDKAKLDGIASWAQVNSITWVKGDSESTYRTGNVNITKSNIWLGNVDNTSDASKPVSTAQQTYIDNADTAIMNYVDGNKQAKTLVQSVAPADAPFEDWEFYYNTTAWVLYVSSWHSSVNDWKSISWLPTGWTEWQILMIVNWTPTWVTPTAKWFKMLSPNSPLTVPYDWYGTEAQYSSATKDSDTEYRTV